MLLLKRVLQNLQSVYRSILQSLKRWKTAKRNAPFLHIGVISEFLGCYGLRLAGDRCQRIKEIQFVSESDGQTEKSVGGDRLHLLAEFTNFRRIVRHRAKLPERREEWKNSREELLQNVALSSVCSLRARLYASSAKSVRCKHVRVDGHNDLDLTLSSAPACKQWHGNSSHTRASHVIRTRQVSPTIRQRINKRCYRKSEWPAKPTIARILDTTILYSKYMLEARWSQFHH